jgi:hypothetical protein
VAENAAGSGFEVGQCQKPLVVCAAVDAKEQIAGHQFSMMYDDAHADWGHRDTIINPNYDTVNIGIAIDGHRIAFYQHFEYTGLEYTDEPLIEGGRLRLAARPLDGHSIGAVAVYYDPSPVGKQPPEIQSLDAYCYGGGFTDECDGVRPIAVVLEPPPPGSQYRDLRPEQVISDVWNERGDGVVEIEADLGSLVGDPGVYTVVVQSGSEPGRLLSGYSIFK